jgi:lysozyme
MRRVHRIVIGLTAGAAVLVLGAGVAAWGINSGVLQVNHPSKRDHPVQGLDVSNHQGPIDWAEVRREGYSFAFVKATEGGDWTDGRYVEHTSGARAAGLRVGAYHYFTFCRDGAEQGRHAVDVVRPQTRAGDLPLVVDLEFGGNCSHVPTVAELDRQFGAFDAVVRAAFGRPPVLYVTGDFQHRYIDGAAARGSALAGHRLWIRDILGRPGGGCGRWAFWQYANGGRVDGVDGGVDLNAYCGDPAAADAEFGTSFAAAA